MHLGEESAKLFKPKEASNLQGQDISGCQCASLGQSAAMNSNSKAMHAMRATVSLSCNRRSVQNATIFRVRVEVNADLKLELH